MELLPTQEPGRYAIHAPDTAAKGAGTDESLLDTFIDHAFIPGTMVALRSGMGAAILGPIASGVATGGISTAVQLGAGAVTLVGAVAGLSSSNLPAAGAAVGGIGGALVGAGLGAAIGSAVVLGVVTVTAAASAGAGLGAGSATVDLKNIDP